MKNMQIFHCRGLNGDIVIPGDKSISHRSVILGSLAIGTTKISNFLNSDDCLTTIEIFKALGVRIEQKKNQIKIYGVGLHGLKKPPKILNAKNSGTTARILMGLLASQSFSCTLTGDHTLKRRPMDRVVIPLTQMGAAFKNKENHLPITIIGNNLTGIKYRLPIASAQVKTALLIAGMYAQGETRIYEPEPSRDHSERMFQYFGIPLKSSKKMLTITKLKQNFRGKSIYVPGDFSSAAFFLVAALIVPNSHIRLKNVGINPTRIALLEVLKKMGGNINVFFHKYFLNNEPMADIEIKSSELKGLQVSNKVVPRMIDEFPILAVAATQAHGRTVIKGAQELAVKESNRLKTMFEGLKRMGAKIILKSDGWIIDGPSTLKGQKVFAYGDHRVAMSLAIAGLVAL